MIEPGPVHSHLDASRVAAATAHSFVLCACRFPMSLAELEQRVDEFAQHAYNRALAVPVVGSVLRSKLATAAWMRVTHTSVHSLQQLRSYLRDVSVGATAAVRGLFAGAQEPAVIESLRKSLLYVLLTSAILFSVLFALFLPPSLCLALWHWVSPLPGDSLMLWEQRLSPWAWIRSSSTVAPSVVLFCFSQISGFEECFFALLAQPNQPDRTGIELEKALRARARPTMLASCWAYVQRAFPLLALGLFVTILQHVPLLGRFVPSLWLLKFASKLGLMKSGGNVSNKIGIAAVLLVIVYSQTVRHTRPRANRFNRARCTIGVLTVFFVACVLSFNPCATMRSVCTCL